MSASAATGSRCSAGSSRTRTGKSASRARATATRWRWPPDRRASMPADLGGQAPGQVLEPAGQSDPVEHVGAARRRSPGGARRRRFSAMVVSKR